jgi:ribosomal protein S18 acetylase RimI-like enzyme
VTLPEPLRTFWYSVDRAPFVEGAGPTRYGVVVTDSRFPRVWDANHSAVLEDVADLTLEELRADLRPALRQAGATHEHIEIWDASRDSPAYRQLRAERPVPGVRPSSAPDVVMVFDPASEPHRARPSEVVVQEITDPDEDFWAWYRGTRSQFGEELPEPVVDQLVRRDREVYAPAGERWFAGLVGGELAGFTSLLSSARVGYLDNVVTMPEFRRKGVATATVVGAMRGSLEVGDELVHLLAEKGASPQSLYERLGFRVVAEVESFTRPLPLGD